MIMEIIWYGGLCVWLKGCEGVVVVDLFKGIVGFIGCGFIVDIVMYGWVDMVFINGRLVKVVGLILCQFGVFILISLEKVFMFDLLGEYEIYGVMVIGVWIFWDVLCGVECGFLMMFVYEFDGIYIVHFGDIGYLFM